MLPYLFFLIRLFYLSCLLSFSLFPPFLPSIRFVSLFFFSSVLFVFLISFQSLFLLHHCSSPFSLPFPFSIHSNGKKFFIEIITFHTFTQLKSTIMSSFTSFLLLLLLLISKKKNTNFFCFCANFSHFSMDVRARGR